VAGVLGPRAGQASANSQFSTLAAEATGHKEMLLRVLDLRFRKDPAGQKRVSQIRAGSGDADLVQDLSDLIVLIAPHMPHLDSCPRGEASAARRLVELSPQLAHLLGAKTITDEARAARQLRNGIYTLVLNTERRIRAAAEYWYGGTEKMKEYAPYVAPVGAAPETDPAEPMPPVAESAGDNQ